MKKEEIVTLAEFNAWANRRILAAAGALTTGQFIRKLGSSFSSVRDTLAHILGVEWGWLERLQGRSPGEVPAAKTYADVSLLGERWAELEVKFCEYMQGLTQAELDEVVEYKTLSFGMGKNPRWQMIHHVVNHGTYHRGQVVTMLKQLKTKGVGTDLITFYRERNAAEA